MKKFQQNMSRELKRPYPDRRKLEAQCVSVVAFGSGITADTDILDWPIWILCINIVAIEMLKSKLPPGKTIKGQNIRLSVYICKHLGRANGFMSRHFYCCRWMQTSAA